MKERELSEIQAEQIELRLTDSLHKIFMKREPLQAPCLRRLSALQGETVSFQAAYRYLTTYYSSQMKRQATKNPSVLVSVESTLPSGIHIRRVISVPSAYPAYPDYDQGYFTNEPGLFPDILRELDENDPTIQIIPYFYRSLWIDTDIPANCPAGIYTISIIFSSLEGEELTRASLQLEVIPQVLAPQTLKRTEWFYADCLQDYYGVTQQDESFWQIVENFMKPMPKRGINMILTPLFNYPLDALIGKTRTTMQLVKVSRKSGSYTFDFTDFERWIRLAQKTGFSYFEMSHLFSQWGAVYAPPVLIEENGQTTLEFGWNTKADSPEYTSFLQAFLPELTAELETLGIHTCTYFHVSDEPNKGNMATYQKARDIIAPYLKNYPILDAMSTLDIYRDGILEYPVPTTEHIMEFLEEGMKEPWIYYCSGEFMDVSNRFFAQPAFRTRILGVQMYLYNIQGFLHWGYNFYNSQYSKRHLNPYAVTDADDAFPSGDSFLVYPGEDKKPEESLRMMLMNEAIQDQRALQTLEQKKGRSFVIELIHTIAGMDITFTQYPQDPGFLLDLREAVNHALK